MIAVAAAVVGASIESDDMVSLSHCNLQTCHRILTVSITTDDDHGDRRQQKRRYEEPLAVKVRKEMLTIAESVRRAAALCP